jgi:PadR family transcriptional regulator, regulatory protein PadR
MMSDAAIPEHLEHSMNWPAVLCGLSRQKNYNGTTGFFLLTVYRTQRFSCRMSIRRYKSTELLQGTLDLLILKTLVHGEFHGLAIAHRVEQITNGAFEVKPGSLFPALHSMEEAGWLASSWGESENRRKAKFYRLTKAGRRQLQTETNDWRKVSGAITAALRAT